MYTFALYLYLYNPILINTMGDNEADNYIGVDAVGDSDSDKDGDNFEMAISRNFYDFESIGPIDSDVESFDEVKAFCDIAKAVFKATKKPKWITYVDSRFAFCFRISQVYFDDFSWLEIFQLNPLAAIFFILSILAKFQKSRFNLQIWSSFAFAS